MLDSTFIEVIRLISKSIPYDVKWALDGSTSLALQGIDVKPHDIDILTDSEGAVKIQEVLKEYNEIPITHSSNGKYDSYFGIFRVNGIKVEVMGDLRVFRDGKWSALQNPSSMDTVHVNIEELSVPVVSVKSQTESGYLSERLKRKD
ncbi:nucleotidyltransferase domain-containing protein [Cuniculiplasma sp. SKW3]|uniref:nucleotidyltransferase domain-containing protein n=1 Tax=Cuniculiplasma sp. SKW3 TaxID=3400170 RepID=UPI003FD1E2F3